MAGASRAYIESSFEAVMVSPLRAATTGSLAGALAAGWACCACCAASGSAHATSDKRSIRFIKVLQRESDDAVGNRVTGGGHSEGAVCAARRLRILWKCCGISADNVAGNDSTNSRTFGKSARDASTWMLDLTFSSRSSDAFADTWAITFSMSRGRSTVDRELRKSRGF